MTEEHKLQVSKNKVVRKASGPNLRKVKLSGEWKIYCEKLCNSNSSHITVSTVKVKKL
jgi:hypothetical protein